MDTDTRRRASERDPVGIVIQPGTGARPTATVWAYLWSADAESGEPEWHKLVPVQRSAADPGGRR